MTRIAFFVIGMILGNLWVRSCCASTITITKAITSAAIEQGFDPALALAVAEVESGLRPNATGKAGEVGLFQLHPRFFKNAPYEVKANADLGVKHLLFWQRNCPSKQSNTFVNCFNAGKRAFRFPKRTPYYKKVISAYAKRTHPIRVGAR